MTTDGEKVDTDEPVNTSPMASINKSDCNDSQGLREIQYKKGYVRKRKRSRNNDFTTLFEWASLKEKVDGELVLQSLVAKLEQRFGLSLTSSELKSLVPNVPLNVEHSSVFGPRTHISRLIRNEVEALYATNDDAGIARAILLQLWDKRVVAAVADSRRRKVSMKTLDLIVQAHDSSDDSDLRNKYDELKGEDYHEAVAYLLHSNNMSACVEAIELLLEHKFYWDAAVLTRRYLTPSHETFNKTFTTWAKALVHKEKSSNFRDKNKRFKIDVAKCYIMMEMYGMAASQLAKQSNDLKLLLLASRLSLIDVKAAELTGDSNAIEIAKQKASEIGAAAIRRAVVMCQWDVATALSQLMGVEQDWSHAISMHQALLLRLRPLLSQSRLHQNDQFIQKIPTNAFPTWAANIVTDGGAFVKGVWEYWKATFPVVSYDKSAANALNLRDVDGIARDSQRHLILFDVACQLVVFLMQAASEQKDVAHKTFTALLESCRCLDQIEAEMEKIFREMVVETSDDEALKGIIDALTAVATERENATKMAKQNESAKESVVDQGDPNMIEKDASIIEETELAADDPSAVKEMDAPAIADDANGTNSTIEEESSEELNVAEKAADGAEAVDAPKNENVDDGVDTKGPAADRDQPHNGSMSDQQQVDDAPRTEPTISENDPDPCCLDLPATPEDPTAVGRVNEEMRKIVNELVSKVENKTASSIETLEQNNNAL